MNVEENNDYILLKWGTLKGWCLEHSPEALKALKEWGELGHTLSAMAQKDTPRQKELICIIIDKVNGSVSSDWDDTDWTNDREAAKKYVMEYGNKKQQHEYNLRKRTDTSDNCKKQLYRHKWR